MTEQNPKLQLKLLPLNKEVKIVFQSPVASTSGTGQFGEWMLYPISVENLSVKKGSEILQSYTGDAVAFISLKSKNAQGVEKPVKIWNKIVPQLEEGQSVFLITKLGKENPKTGMVYTDFEVKLEDGTVLE